MFWYSGPWTRCQGGEQTRTVACRNIDDGKTATGRQIVVLLYVKSCLCIHISYGLKGCKGQKPLDKVQCKSEVLDNTAILGPCVGCSIDSVELIPSLVRYHVPSDPIVVTWDLKTGQSASSGTNQHVWISLASAGSGSHYTLGIGLQAMSGVFTYAPTAFPDTDSLQNLDFKASYSVNIGQHPNLVKTTSQFAFEELMQYRSCGSSGTIIPFLGTCNCLVGSSGETCEIDLNKPCTLQCNTGQASNDCTECLCDAGSFGAGCSCKESIHSIVIQGATFNDHPVIVQSIKTEIATILKLPHDQVYTYADPSCITTEQGAHIIVLLRAPCPGGGAANFADEALMLNKMSAVPHSLLRTAPVAHRMSVQYGFKTHATMPANQCQVAPGVYPVGEYR